MYYPARLPGLPQSRKGTKTPLCENLFRLVVEYKASFRVVDAQRSISKAHKGFEHYDQLTILQSKLPYHILRQGSFVLPHLGEVEMRLDFPAVCSTCSGFISPPLMSRQYMSNLRSNLVFIIRVFMLIRKRITLILAGK